MYFILLESNIPFIPKCIPGGKYCPVIKKLISDTAVSHCKQKEQILEASNSLTGRML